MQTYQPIPLPLEETRETVANEAAETVVAVQVALPDEHVPRGKGSEDSATEPILAPPRVHRRFALPPWPISQPGPEVTAPSPAKALVPTRLTDQVRYDFSDQERGLPGLARADQVRESASESTETRQTASLLLKQICNRLSHRSCAIK